MIYNSKYLTLNDYLVRNFITFEANQDSMKNTFASKYFLDLVNKYIEVLKGNREIIDEVEDKFMNVFTVKLMQEMGETEDNAVRALKLANNNLVEAVKILGMIKHENIDYYLELAAREVRVKFTCRSVCSTTWSST